jgi:hypothetical protein
MHETDILYALDQACQGLNLVFQVVQEAETLYIYINRPSETALQSDSIAGTVQRAIAPLKFPHLKTLCLYSRELGTVEPDWETSITLPSTEEPVIESHPQAPELREEAIAQQLIKEESKAISTVSEPLETQDLELDPALSSTDLSQYCFTRNRTLLTSEILPPTEDIARVLQRFHALASLDQQQALPALDNFFKSNSLPPLHDLNPETQAWLHQLAQINPAELRKTAIWMSRYCLNPETTVEQVKSVLPLEETISASPSLALETTSKKQQGMISQPSSSSLEMYSTVAPVRPRMVNEPQPIPAEAFPAAALLAAENTQSFLGRYALLVPLIWLLCTATLIIVDVQSPNTPQIADTFCQTAISQPYCQLAVQLVGSEKIQHFQKATEAEPAMIEGVKEKSVTDCAASAYINAGYNKDGIERSTDKTPDSKLQQETVFPGLFVVDVQLPDKTGKPVRTACAYHQTVDPVMLRERPSRLAASVIPTDWPAQPIENKTNRTNLSETSWTISSLLRNLGTNTLFTGIGLLVAVYFGLGVQVDSLPAVYKSALVLGITETLTGLIPIFGFLRFTVLEVLSLLLTSAIIKDLKLEWSLGYKVVASGALAIIAIRALLNWLLFFAVISFLA